jgi:hypothetical protein
MPSISWRNHAAASAAFRYSAKLPCMRILSASNASGGKVLLGLPEEHVEIAVSPVVVTGQLVQEDLPEGGPEVTQRVRALEGDPEVDMALNVRGQIQELAQLNADVGRRSGSRSTPA